MTHCDHCRLVIEGSEFDQDGTGDRCCSACRRLEAERPSVRVAPLAEGDLELVLAWRSNPEIYRHFRKQDEPLEWDEHVAWFESRTTARHDFVIHFEGRRVGGVSIGVDDDVGIYLGDYAARGRGVASAALSWLCDRFADRTPLYAEIHEANDTSQKLFERCGFEREAREGEWLQYLYVDGSSGA